MKIKIKKVYYCDFCKKHSLLPLTKHEKHCTLNPHRQCGMCEQNYDYENLLKLIKVKKIKYFNGPVGARIKTSELNRLIDGCPVCALTLLRLFMKKNKNKYVDVETDFDFKKEKKEWWHSKNDEEESGLYDYS
jgi:hypothetical protein